MRRKLLLALASVLTSAAAVVTPASAATDPLCPDSDFSCTSFCTDITMYCKGRLIHQTGCNVDTAQSTCEASGLCGPVFCDPFDPGCAPYQMQCYYYQT